VDICVEAHRQVKLVLDGADEVCVWPVGLGCCRYVAKGGGPGIGIHRTKGSNANGSQPLLGLLCLEKVKRPAQRFVRCRGRETRLRPDVTRTGAHSADKLCATCFNSTKERHLFLSFWTKQMVPGKRLLIEVPLDSTGEPGAWVPAICTDRSRPASAPPLPPT